MIESPLFLNRVLVLTLASIPFFALAWRAAWREQHGAALSLLLIGGLLLRTGPALDPFLHEWDERYHALVAKHMLNDPFRPKLYAQHVLPYDALSWTEGYHWLHKPPFPLWSMAASMRVFGISEFSLRLPSLIASTLGIWVCFGIVRHLWGRRVGFVAAFLYSVQGAIIELGSGRWATDHTDTLFTFLIGACVLSHIRSLRANRYPWLILTGVLLGCAVLSKWLPALVVVPVQMLLAAASKKRRTDTIITEAIIVTSVAAIIAAPWFVYVHLRYPELAAHESLMRMKHITEALDGQSGGPMYYLDRIRIVYGELIYLPMIWFLFKLKKPLIHPARWAIMTWAFLLIGFFSFAATKMHGYILPATIPLLSITALFWVILERGLRQWKEQRWLRFTLLLLLLALPVRYCLERLKPFDDHSDLYSLRESLRELTMPDGKLVVFNCPVPIEAMFYGDCIAYHGHVGPELLESLTQQGYHVLDFQKVVQ